MENKRIKWNYELVKEFTENKGYKLLSTEYKKQNEKLTFMCKEEHIFDMNFQGFKKLKECPICSGKWLNYDVVKKYIEDKNYKLLSEEYINNRTKLKLQCPKGHIFDMCFSNFKTGQRCPICAKENNLKRIQSQRLKYEDVKKYIESQGDELLSTEYISAREKLKIKCKEGHIYDTRWDNYKTGYRCPTCGIQKSSDKQKHSYEYVKNFIEMYGDELLSDQYIHSHAKLKIKCKKGHIYDTAFTNYQSGSRCPICKISHGENNIKNILDKYEIDYIQQYKFKDCKFKRQLPFDFYLPDYNILIEYDGEQHFIVKEHFGGYEGFIDIKIRDTIKDIYCKDNNIKLIRIPYYNKNNLENILIKELKIS